LFQPYTRVEKYSNDAETVSVFISVLFHYVRQALRVRCYVDCRV